MNHAPSRIIDRSRVSRRKAMPVAPLVVRRAPGSGDGGPLEVWHGARVVREMDPPLTRRFEDERAPISSPGAIGHARGRRTRCNGRGLQTNERPWLVSFRTGSSETLPRNSSPNDDEPRTRGHNMHRQRLCRRERAQRATSRTRDSAVRLCSAVFLQEWHDVRHKKFWIEDIGDVVVALENDDAGVRECRRHVLGVRLAGVGALLARDQEHRHADVTSELRIETDRELPADLSRDRVRSDKWVTPASDMCSDLLKQAGSHGGGGRNRTHPTRITRRTRFEDEGGHQTPFTSAPLLLAAHPPPLPTCPQSNGLSRW
jgi:hypothetical protein